MAEETIINVTTPAPTEVVINVTEDVAAVEVIAQPPAVTPVEVEVTQIIQNTVIEVSAVGQKGDQGPAGPGIEPIYQKTFGSTTNDTILPAEHGLSVVRGVTVLAPAPNYSEVEVYVEQRNDNSVFIDSNSNLNNYILKMY